MCVREQKYYFKRLIHDFRNFRTLETLETNLRTALETKTNTKNYE